MQLDDFEIGKEFYGLAGFVWKCTDKGTRTITAIMLDDRKDPSWYQGPPYIVDEVIFDENDMQKCYTNMYDNLSKRVESLHTSYHPNFDIKDVTKMMKGSKDKYPYQKLLKKDRVGKDGSILHPYGAVKKDDAWYIKTFEIFTREYDTMLDEDFIRLPLSSQEAMKVRKEYLDKK